MSEEKRTARCGEKKKSSANPKFGGEEMRNSDKETSKDVKAPELDSSGSEKDTNEKIKRYVIKTQRDLFSI